MKLYTEADLKKVISIYSEEYKISTDEILVELNLQPIELPSDEEIKQLNPYPFVSGGKDLLWYFGAKAIVKLIHDKIQGGNK
jgi:hypothetical protein